MKYLITLIACFTIGIASEGNIGGVTFFDFVFVDDSTAFNFQRQYFYYATDISEDLQFKVIFDVSRSDTDSKLNTYLKKAQIDYQTSYAKISMGLIGTNTYGIQENNWGYRFIEKSAIDKHGFSSTADLGFGISRSLIENLNMSLQVTNGEGFKMPQGDKYHKISFNATYGERNLNNNDGYNAGLIFSTENTESDPKNMTSVFGGFAGMGFRLGAEYDLSQGDTESNIISASANCKVIDNVDAFVRYDMYDLNTSIEDDVTSYMIVGALLECADGLSVAPNLRMTSYEGDEDSVTEYRVNFQFKF